MDGFKSTEGVVVLAGTNRADILDKAILRPGRFDRQITVDKPDIQGRRAIFAVHLASLTLDGKPEDFARRMASLTPGFAGAEIANLCNEAAIVAARRNAEAVSFRDFEQATDRVLGGLETNRIMSVEEKRTVAYHEAGHAVAGWFLEHADPLLKVTIVPRGKGALGFAQYLPKELALHSREALVDMLCMALGGRASEELNFEGRVTTGASDDLKRVTAIAYAMIQIYGMNAKIGPMSFPRDNDGGGMSERPYSDKTAEVMDEEARRVIEHAYDRTKELLSQKHELVEQLAEKLIALETINHTDIVQVLGPRPFARHQTYAEFIDEDWVAEKDDEISALESQDKEEEESETEETKSPLPA